MYQSEISRNIFTARSLQALHSEIKRKHVQHNNLHKTVEITAKKYNSVLTIPNMVVVHGRAHISFMLILKTKYYIINKECQLLSFRICKISGGENLLGKQSRPRRFRGLQVNICHVVIYSS